MGVFDDIYKGDAWGFGSGHGSLPSVTKTYRKFIEDFIRENDIKKVVDYGCGDWQFSRLINWGEATYTGLDIVDSVVQRNTTNYGSDSISFQTIKPGESKLPKGDLLISKDVLQHLAEAEIQAFIRDVLPRYKFALITNCVIPVETLNASIVSGEFRPLDLRKKPFGVNGAVVHAFTGPKVFSRSTRSFFPSWKKQVLLITQ
jgi:hypothetical protein